MGILTPILFLVALAGCGSTETTSYKSNDSAVKFVKRFSGSVPKADRRDGGNSKDGIYSNSFILWCDSDPLDTVNRLRHQFGDICKARGGTWESPICRKDRSKAFFAGAVRQVRAPACPNSRVPIHLSALEPMRDPYLETWMAEAYKEGIASIDEEKKPIPNTRKRKTLDCSYVYFTGDGCGKVALFHKMMGTPVTERDQFLRFNPLQCYAIRADGTLYCDGCLRLDSHPVNLVRPTTELYGDSVSVIALKGGGLSSNVRMTVSPDDLHCSR